MSNLSLVPILHPDEILTGCAKLSALFPIELFYPDFDKYSIMNIIVRLMEWYSGTGI